ncbi:hypothetical protein RSW32_26230, partial [Escherichia coli]|uniref:hypothetical protein n=1 Tax=Escherichia coli TaxID=562 RepID=UPI0028DDD5C4
MIQENGSFFGAPSVGAFRFGDVNTMVLDASHTFDLGAGWGVSGYGSLGWSRMSNLGNSLFSGGQLVTSRYGVT